MKSSLYSLALILVLSSCTTTRKLDTAAPAPTSASEEEETNAEDEAEDKAQELEELAHKLAVAQLKLKLAHFAADGTDLELVQKIDHAQANLEGAFEKLSHFESIEAPTRAGRARMNLQSAKDFAMEAEEELEQIALMYKDQDLEDMTAEFVIQRGKRRAQRSEKRVKYSEMDLRSLVEHKLKQEMKAFASGVKKAQESLAALKREGHKNKLNRTLKITEAERAVTKAEKALAKKEAKGDDA